MVRRSADALLNQSLLLSRNHVYKAKQVSPLQLHLHDQQHDNVCSVSSGKAHAFGERHGRWLLCQQLILKHVNTRMQGHQRQQPQPCANLSGMGVNCTGS